jgi:hypothetical protein
MNLNCIQKVFASAKCRNRARMQISPHSEGGMVDQRPNATGMCSRNVGLEGWSSCWERQLGGEEERKAKRSYAGGMKDIKALDGSHYKVRRMYTGPHVYIILMETVLTIVIVNARLLHVKSVLEKIT